MAAYTIDPVLLDIAQWRMSEMEKTAFTPASAAGGGAPGGMPGGDPSAGGMPPGGPGGMPPGMDPSAGGMPPGMDPSAGGGAPPMDPSAGGMPPDPSAGGAGGPDLMTVIQQAVSTAVQQAMSQTGAGGAPAGPAGPGKGAKIDPGMIYMVLGRIQKLMTNLYKHLNIPLDPSLLEDDLVAQSVAGQTQPAAPSADPSAGAGAQQLPALGGNPALGPIQPPGGSTKTSSIRDIFSQRPDMSGMLSNFDTVRTLMNHR